MIRSRVGWRSVGHGGCGHQGPDSHWPAVPRLRALGGGGCGYRRACLVIGREQEAIRRYYSELPVGRLQIAFANQEEPRGTADAVAAAETFAGGDPFAVINSDTYYPIEALRFCCGSRARPWRCSSATPCWRAATCPRTASSGLRWPNRPPGQPGADHRKTGRGRARRPASAAVVEHELLAFWTVDLPGGQGHPAVPAGRV